MNLSQFFTAYNQNLPHFVKREYRKDFEQSDRFFLILMFSQWLLASTVGGLGFGHYQFGFIAGGITTLFSLVAYHYYKGEAIARMIMGSSTAVFTIIFVTQQHGLIEAHFHYFIGIGVLIRYRDLTPLLVHTVIIVIHHVVFTYCQTINFEIFNIPIVIFNWGDWIPFTIHIFAAVLGVMVCALLIYKDIGQFTLSLTRLEQAQSLTNQLQEMITQVQDTSIQIAGKSDSLNHTIESLSEASLIQNNSLRVSRENVDTIHVQSKDNVQYAESVSQNVSSLITTSDQLSKSISTVASATEQASANMTEITKSTSSISHDISSISESTETMSDALTVIHHHTQKAQQDSLKAKNHAIETLETMNQLDKVSENIGRVVKLIANIAQQTNMLALNATIEAAGAGESGKGFAVVAGEVKELAQQTANANNEIANQIAQSQQLSNQALKNTRNMDEAIAGIVETSEMVNQSISEQTSIAGSIKKSLETIATASNESARSIEEAFLGLKEISHSSTIADQNARTSHQELSHALEKLSNITENSSVISQGITQITIEIENVQNSVLSVTDSVEKNKESSHDLSNLASKLKLLLQTFDHSSDTQTKLIG